MDNYNEQNTQPQPVQQDANTTQPQDAPRQEMPPLKPDSNLVLAIFTTVCCCLPLGLVAVIKASNVDSLYYMKQYQAAQMAANEAHKWSMIGIAVGFAVYVIYIGIYAVAFIAGLSGNL